MSPTDTGHEQADGGRSVAAVSLRDISKAFGGRTVLASVSLDIAPGSVVALLGANGAGKSTLIKILSGVHADHGGEVLVDGSPAALQSPLAARQLGIQTVHQRISEGVVPGLTVAENLVFEELAQKRGNRSSTGAGCSPAPGRSRPPSASTGPTPSSSRTSPNSASPTASCSSWPAPSPPAPGC